MLQKNFFKYIVTAFLTFSSSMIWAAEEGAETASTDVSTSSESLEEAEITQFCQSDCPLIRKFRIVGLKRTHEYVIQNDLERFLGLEASETTLHEVETAMQSEGIFSKVSLSSEDTDEGAIISITVDEKVSFLPIPMAMFSNDRYAVGGIVMDSNAFGLRDMLVLGGVYASNMWMTVAAFQQPARGKRPGFSIFANYFNLSKKLTDLKDNTYLKYDASTFMLKAAVTEKPVEYLEIAPSLGFRTSDLKAKPKYGVTLNSYTDFSAGIQVKLSALDWNGFFMSEKKAVLHSEIFTTTEGDLSETFMIRESIQKPLLPRLRLTEEAAFYMSYDTRITDYKGDGTVGINLLPTDFVTDKLGGAIAGLEWGVWKSDYALISLYGNYQSTCFKDVDNDWKFHHGPGTGLKLYLSKIAFPALAVGAVYNVTADRWKTAFSIGMSL